MKNHPIIFSILIIIVIVAVLSGGILAMLYFMGDSTSTMQFGDQIACIDIQGTISSGGNITKLLDDYSRKKSIKAIILRINSPGGGVAPSQEIYREIERVRAKKPIIAFMGSVAASGGYYVASAATKIMASPGTLTGSIGVIMEFANFEELLNKIGISAQVIKAGKFKDIGSPIREMTERERKMLLDLVDDVHSQFISDIAKARGMNEEIVREIADGRIFSGRQAKAMGLIDELGNFQDAVTLAKKLANLKGEVRIISPRSKRSAFWEMLFEGAFQALMNNLDTHLVEIKAVP